MKGYNLHDLELKEIIVGGEIEKAYHQFLDTVKFKKKTFFKRKIKNIS